MNSFWSFCPTPKVSYYFVKTVVPPKKNQKQQQKQNNYLKKSTFPQMVGLLICFYLVVGDFSEKKYCFIPSFIFDIIFTLYFQSREAYTDIFDSHYPWPTC